MSNPKAILDKLRQIVEFENTHLKKGEFHPLKETISLKQDCLSELNSLLLNNEGREVHKEDGADLRRIQGLLQDNEQLMKSAINSVKFAYKQINAIRNREAKVGAYDRFGKMVNIAESQGLKIKRV